MALTLTDLGGGLYQIAGSDLAALGGGLYQITSNGLTDLGGGLYQIANTSVLPIRVTSTVGSLVTVRSSLSGPATTLTVVDDGDGTFTVSGAGVTDNGNGTLTISDVGVTDNGNRTYTITDSVQVGPIRVTSTVS